MFPNQNCSLLGLAELKKTIQNKSWVKKIHFEGSIRILFICLLTIVKVFIAYFSVAHMGIYLIGFITVQYSLS